MSKSPTALCELLSEDDLYASCPNGIYNILHSNISVCNRSSDDMDNQLLPDDCAIAAWCNFGVIKYMMCPQLQDLSIISSEEMETFVTTMTDAVSVCEREYIKRIPSTPIPTSHPSAWVQPTSGPSITLQEYSSLSPTMATSKNDSYFNSSHDDHGDGDDEKGVHSVGTKLGNDVIAVITVLLTCK